MSLLATFNMSACDCDKKATITKPDNNFPPNKPVEDLVLTATKNFIKGQEPIQLKIANHGTHATISALKLRIARIAGSYAHIQGAQDQGNGQYEIEVKEVAAHNTMMQELTVVPGEDMKATLECQLIYQGQPQGNKVIITWEKGIALVLEDVKYDQDSKYITYSLVNKGSALVPLPIKLTYKTTTPGIRLGGVLLQAGEAQTIDLPSSMTLRPLEKVENIKLYQLDFGSNSKADFEFRVLDEGSSTIPALYTFTNVDIKLELVLNYDQNSQLLNYTISNNGKSIAKDVKLVYKHISSNLHKAMVFLGGKKNGETVPIDLAALNGNITGTLPLDFKGHDQADFEFKVVCNQITLEQLTQKQTFQAPSLKLEKTALLLECVTTLPNSTKNLQLNEPEEKATINIKNNLKSLDSKPINLDEALELQITRKVGSTGYLSEKKGGSGANTILIHPKNLRSIIEHRDLYVNPQKDAELKFELQIFYKKQPISNVLVISWKAHEKKFQLEFIKTNTTNVAPKNYGRIPAIIKLTAEEKSIQFKIKQEPIKINLTNVVDDLTVKLEKNSTNSMAIFSTKNQPLTAMELKGNELGSNLGETISLAFEPNGELDLSFKLQLYYQGKAQGNPLIFDWNSARSTAWVNSLQQQVNDLIHEKKLNEAAQLLNSPDVQEKIKGCLDNEEIIKSIAGQILTALQKELRQQEVGTKQMGQEQLTAAENIRQLAEIAKEISLTAKFNAIETKQLAQSAYAIVWETLGNNLTFYTAPLNTDTDPLFAIANKLKLVPQGYSNKEALEKFKGDIETAVSGKLILVQSNKQQIEQQPSLGKNYIEKIHAYATQAVKLTQKAKDSGFESLVATQTVQQIYTIAVESYLILAQQIKQDITTYRLANEDQLNQLSDYVKQAVILVKEARKNGFETPTATKPIQQIYTIAVECYIILAQQIKQDMPEVITTNDEPTKKTMLASLRDHVEQATEFVKEAQVNGFESPALNQALQEIQQVQEDVNQLVSPNK